MKRNVVGALLSALVFPGVGQLWLGRRARGILFAVVALVAAWIYVAGAFDQASALAGQLLSGALPSDPAALAARLEAAPTPLAETVAGWALAACWLGAIVEALLVGGA
ncbi:hypothetical protein [uncultured Massilia sp.]|uniref:hypothetical protein n=1 Tax=uncultured Massilia sp. TaxID=169973 RepID=UPI0025EAD1CE|nr:hypothetical protein [uncultured Massilia sp.]